MEAHLENLSRTLGVIGLRENVFRARIEKNYLQGKLQVS
jgi:hypothetical protein